MDKFSFGSDPEFMLTRDGKYYSAIRVVPGDTAQRVEKKGHQYYWDNVLAECAIRPASDKTEVIDNFKECLQIYADLVRPYKLVVQASQEYPEDQLTDKNARIAGCQPDFCAYEIKCKRPPKNLFKQTNLRSGGGHIHLGGSFSFLHEEDPLAIVTVRLLDFFVGIPSLFIDHDPTSPQRRELYGKAGRFRNKPYGLEYRSLGNFWLVSPKLVSLVFDLCQFVVEFMAKGRHEEFYKVDEDLYWELPPGKLNTAYKDVLFKNKDLRLCLDKNIKDQAYDFFLLVLSWLPKDLRRRLKDATKPKIYDFYKEWKLK